MANIPKWPNDLYDVADYTAGLDQSISKEIMLILARMNRIETEILQIIKKIEQITQGDKHES